MIDTEYLALTYGLSSALTWGAADFSGGLATRRGNVYSVILFSQIIGLGLLVALGFLIEDKWAGWPPLFLGGLGGLAGALGMVALYKGLAAGRMGVVAPISAVVTALLPIVFSSFIEGSPKGTQMAGFVAAILAVWFISLQKGDARIQMQEGLLAVVAGLGFGFFFIIIDHVTSQTLIWPLVSARLASMIMISVSITLRREVSFPGKNQFGLIALAGILDSSGNAFYALAAQIGRLDVAATLASLYPAATVILAWFILKERLQGRQLIGVAVAFLALFLIGY